MQKFRASHGLHPQEIHSTLEVYKPDALDSTLEVYQPQADLEYDGQHFQQQKRFPNQNRLEKRICRLRATTFWLSLVLGVVLLLMIVGGVVGGVLGSRYLSRKGGPSSSSSSAERSSSLPSPSPTSLSTSATSITVPPPSSSPTNTPVTGLFPSNNCPGSDKTTHTVSISDQTVETFVISCGVDWSMGVEALDGNGTVTDLLGILTDSMEHCIAGCVSYNHNQGGTPCRAVSYTANLTEYWVPKQNANCFLKDKPGLDIAVSDIACAKLVK